MQSPIEQRWAEHAAHVAIFVQERTGQGIAPAEKQGSNEDNRHDLGIN